MICIKLWPHQERELVKTNGSSKLTKAKAVKVTWMMIAIAILFLVYELSFDIIRALLYLGFMIEPLEPTLKNGLKIFFANLRIFPFTSESINLQQKMLK